MSDFNINPIQPTSTPWPLDRNNEGITYTTLPPGTAMPDLPYVMEPTALSPQAIFDTSIPRCPDGSIDRDGLIQRFYRLLFYSMQGDSMDYNTLLDIFAFIINISGVWQEIKSEDKDAIQNILLITMGQSHFSNVLADAIIPAVIHGFFYKNGQIEDLVAKTTEFADKVNSVIQIFASCPIVEPLKDKITSTIKELPDWMASHIKHSTLTLSRDVADKPFDIFLLETMSDWQTKCALNTSITERGGLLEQMQECVITRLKKINPITPDPSPRFLAFKDFLIEKTNDLQIQLASRAYLLDAITNGLGDPTKTISSLWSKGEFTEASMKTFYSNLNELGRVCGLTIDPATGKLTQGPGDVRFANLAEQIAPLYKDFMALKEADGGIEVEITSTKRKVTLGELYKECIETISADVWGTLVDAVNGLYPNLGNPSATPPTNPFTSPNYTRISADVASIPVAITNTSTTQGQEMQGLEGICEKFLALITAICNSYLDQLKKAQQNMTAAN
jgi:hypothetical protein